MALDGLGRHKESLSSFDRALKIRPSFLPALKAASETAYRSRDSRAGSYLEKLLREDPASEPAHAMAAVLAFESGDCAKAAAHFERGASQVRGNELASSQYGHCLLQLGRSKEAARLFQELLEKTPASATLRHNLAVAQLQDGQPAAALSTLTASAQAIDAGSLNLLAAAQAAGGRAAEALATLRSAAQQDPHDERNYLDLAVLCQRDGALSLAIEFLNAGLRRLPGSGRLYAARGVLLAQLGEMEKAEADFEQAALLEPEQAYSAAGLSVLFSETGRAEGAAKLLRQKLARSPHDPNLNSLLADALMRDGVQPGQPEFEEARRALSRAIRARPGFARAHAALGKLSLREGRPSSGTGLPAGLGEGPGNQAVRPAGRPASRAHTRRKDRPGGRSHSYSWSRSFRQ